MSMMAYKGTMYMVFFNYAMMIANWIGSFIFPNSSPQIVTYGGSILSGIDIFATLSNGNIIQTLALTAGVLTLFAFSLLIPTIPFVFTFFALSGFITASYIWQLHLPLIFTTPITMGIAIVYYAGAAQYAARSSFQGS
jgi:hypothetical protein